MLIKNILGNSKDMEIFSVYRKRHLEFKIRHPDEGNSQKRSTPDTNTKCTISYVHSHSPFPNSFNYGEQLWTSQEHLRVTVMNPEK